MNRNEIIKKRKINYNDFYGKRYSPSIIIKKYFLKLFDKIYKNFSVEFIIKKIYWDTNNFRIILNDYKNGENFEILFKDNKGKNLCNGKFCTKNICIGFHNTPSNKNFLVFLLNFFKKGEFLTIELLLKILSNDPKAKKEFYQIFWKSKRPPFSIIQDWGQNLHKMRFIVQEGVLRNLDQSLEFTLPEITIQHSERECLGIGPEIPSYKEFKFFNFPKEYYNHSFDKYFYLNNEEKLKYLKKSLGKGGFEFTDLDEDDIVMGNGTNKLQKTLDDIIPRIKKDNIKMISFNCCCVPRIIGDDIYSTLKNFKEKIDIPFVLEGQLEKTPFEQKIILLEYYLNKIDKNLIKINKNSISLFGYHENIYLKLINDILKKTNIEINSIFIPSINIELLPKIYESELFVFSSNKFQEEIFEYPFKNMGKEYISPMFPYNIENTINWLKTIYSKLGLNYNIGKDEQKIIDEYKNLVSYVKKNNYRVGIVFIGKQEIEKFLNPDYMNNIDIIGFLEEMGFGIDFFVYDEFEKYLIINNEQKYFKEDGNHKIINRAINNKIKDNYNILFFSSEDEMYKELGNSEINLLYSDIYYDDRVIKLGLNQFNLKQFNLGFAGALDTIKEMIKLCEMNYFKKFSKYIN